MDMHLTRRLPDGSYVLRQDLDYWELAQCVGEMETELRKLRQHSQVLEKVVQQRGLRLRDWAEKMTAGKIAASSAVVG